MSSSSTKKVPHHLASFLTILLVQVTTMVADHTSTSIPPVPCLPEQASALLRLKHSFNTTAGDYSTAFQSWVAGTDCCRWDGVGCSGADGRVTSLDLSGHHLQAGSFDPALFRLTSLNHLNLSSNNFSMSKLPVITGFEQLTQLTHLDISDTNIAGEIPASIGGLVNLVYLDLSTSFHIVEYDKENSEMIYMSDLFRQLKAPNMETLLANLTSLEELHMGMVDMSSNGQRWCDHIAKSTPKLQVLSLPWCSLSGPICASFSAMQSLNTIELHYNHLSGPVPEFLVSFSNLAVLQLQVNKFEGWLSPVIFQNKLRTINLSENPGISGNLPNFSQDSSLENLFVSGTNFTGTIPSSISNLKSLKKLDLGASGFYGMLPSSLGRLKYLDSLQVSGLQIVGSMPSWISNLTSLTVLQFSNCGLSGLIPSSIGNLRELTKLSLYNCNFSGKVPPQIFNLTRLHTLQLHMNNFAGMVELTSFSKMENLSVLNLSYNELVVVDGENSTSLVSFPKLKLLRLASCNISIFPSILGHQYEITSLDLSYNQLEGAIPQWAWKTWKGLYFLVLNISHNNITSLGSDPLLPLQVEYFDLSFNSIEGPMPVLQGDSTMLDYTSNQFSSMPLHSPGDTIIFMASKNKLSGNIPRSICTTARRLQLIDLSYNILSGSIPSCLMEDVTRLQVLNLKANKLVGKVPDNIKKGCALQALDLSDNLIEGKLPRSLVACRNMEILDVGSNQISDSFPCWLSELRKLQVLVIKSNKFTGQVMDPSYTVDGNSCEFPELRIADMSSNTLNGTLPEVWFMMLKSMMDMSDNETSVLENKYFHEQTYKFTITVTYKGYSMTFSKILATLILIDVSNNAFHGAIPETIGELVLLHGLNMSHNDLTGPIPSQFGKLNQIESLDLSMNELSGEIPKELASLNFLSTLNLSYNRLVGRIPDSYQFSTFSGSSFLGNTGLCGPPLSKQCDNLEEPNVTLENSIDVILLLFTVLGFGVSFVMTILIVWKSHMIKTHYKYICIRLMQY
ncbi:hypothetical protein BS78_08G077100 [Paspalum vaginatum]|nr:hypothetical protein BS78_08G077100 [Paspalum vaginatum]